MVDGIAQKPIEGVNMAYTFDKANANAPSAHHTQYFEMMSVRGLYQDGWMLSAATDAAEVVEREGGEAEPVIFEVEFDRVLAGRERLRPSQRTRFKSSRFQTKTGLPFSRYMP